MKMKYTHAKLASASALIAVVLFLAINLLSNTLFTSARVDLTADRLYTLSDGTKKVLKEIKEPITLRFYFSNKLANGYPAVKSHAEHVKAMLQDYANQNSNITLKIIDPEPFSDEEDEAVREGLKGAPIDQNGTKLYLGLVASNSVDQTQVIPFFSFDRAKFTEYDVTRMLSDLANPHRTKVGIITTIPMELPNIAGLMGGRQSMAASPWAVIQQARQLFDVTTIDTKKEAIPDNIDVLMVVHPHGFSDKLWKAIDQFVMKKGRAIFFVDPDVAYGNEKPESKASDPSRLFSAWGVDVNMNKVVGDRIAATPMPAQGPAGDSGMQLAYLPNLTLTDKSDFNQNDIISASLNTIHVMTAGAVNVTESSGLKLIPLIQTSPRSTLLDVRQLRFGGRAQAGYLLQNFHSDNKQYTIAARIEGKLKSAFASDPGALKESKDNANLIVVADTDLLRDNAWVHVQNFLGYQLMVPKADNGSFVINAMDNLGGTGDLISLRTRGTGTRPFTVVDNLRKQAQEQFLDKEKELQGELKRTEVELNRLQNSSNSGQSLALSPQQQMELERFRQKKVEIRKQLRGVQHDLNREIEHLGSWLKFINIALVPFIVAVFAFVILVYRNRKQAGGR